MAKKQKKNTGGVKKKFQNTAETKPIEIDEKITDQERRVCTVIADNTGLDFNVEVKPGTDIVAFSCTCPDEDIAKTVKSIMRQVGTYHDKYNWETQGKRVVLPIRHLTSENNHRYFPNSNEDDAWEYVEDNYRQVDQVRLQKLLPKKMFKNGLKKPYPKAFDKDTYEVNETVKHPKGEYRLDERERSLCALMAATTNLPLQPAYREWSEHQEMMDVIVFSCICPPNSADKITQALNDADFHSFHSDGDEVFITLGTAYANGEISYKGMSFYSSEEELFEGHVHSCAIANNKVIHEAIPPGMVTRDIENEVCKIKGEVVLQNTSEEKQGIIKGEQFISQQELELCDLLAEKTDLPFEAKIMNVRESFKGPIVSRDLLLTCHMPNYLKATEVAWTLKHATGQDFSSCGNDVYISLRQADDDCHADAYSQTLELIAECFETIEGHRAMEPAIP